MLPSPKRQKVPIPQVLPNSNLTAPQQELAASACVNYCHKAPPQHGSALITAGASPDCSGAVSAAALTHWASLPKNGKPQPNEHTVVAAFVLQSPGGAIHSNSEGCSSNPAQEGDGNVSVGAPGMRFDVVALGSGTKCLSAAARTPDGTLLNDSHAEVIARRALQRWLYSELSAAAMSVTTPATPASVSVSVSAAAVASPPEVKGVRWCGDLPVNPTDAEAIRVVAAVAVAPPSLGSRFFSCTPHSSKLLGSPDEEWKFSLRPGCQLHMWVSQPPCGDASIFGGLERDPPPRNNIGVVAPLDSTPEQRTGAKVIQSPPIEKEATGQAVPASGDVEPAAESQHTGVLRRKPGRGVATLSMSCSDKLARWACLGLQGALLMDFLTDPLFLTSLTVALPSTSDVKDASHSARASAAVGALKRATDVRTAGVGSFLQAPFRRSPPRVSVVQGPLSDVGLYPTSTRTVPSGSSINWSRGCSAANGNNLSVHEVTLSGSGRKAGAAKKGLPTPKNRSSLCKAAMFSQWAQINALLSVQTGNQLSSSTMLNQTSVSGGTLLYSSAKRSAGSSAYSKSWSALREDSEVFKRWLCNPPELENFLAQDTWLGHC